MAAKAFFVVCAQAFLIQTVYSQCLGRIGAGLLGAPLAVPSLASPALPIGGCSGVASTGGGFAVTSASPIAPTGVSVLSENAIEGALAAGGNLPLLGSVAVEGAFPTAGAGSVSYGCGNGEVGIGSEGPVATGILAPGPVGPAPVLSAVPAFAPAVAAPALGLGLAGAAIAPGLAGRALSPGLAGAGIAPGLLSTRAGIAPGIGRGIGCGALY